MQLGSIAKKVKEIPRFSGKSGVFLSFFSYRPQSGLGKHFLGAKWGIFIYFFAIDPVLPKTGSILPPTRLSVIKVVLYQIIRYNQTGFLRSPVLFPLRYPSQSL